jgi:hypothetical protein
MPSLKEVDLSFNALTGPVSVWSSSLLTLQSLARNQLTGTIPESMGRGMPDLITIDYKVWESEQL